MVCIVGCANLGGVGIGSRMLCARDFGDVSTLWFGLLGVNFSDVVCEELLVMCRHHGLGCWV